jgi:hypothetical protein
MPLRATIVTLTVSAALGISAAPASAAPNWQPYSIDDPNWWSCIDSVEVQPHVFLQPCVKANTEHDAQPVAIVGNYSGIAKTISAPDVDLFWPTGGWDNSCGSYSLASGTARACFGTTIGKFDYCSEWLQAKVKITVNGTVYRAESIPTLWC